MLDVVPFNQVLAKIRGYGRILSAPTVQAGKLVPFNPTAPPQLRVRSAAPPKGAPRALRAGCAASNRVPAKIRGCGRMRSAPTERHSSSSFGQRHTEAGDGDTSAENPGLHTLAK